MRTRLAKESGFATLELRIALVIICLVLIVPITSFAALKRQAGDTTAKTSLNIAIKQIDMYHLQYGTYSGLTPAALEARDSRRPERPRYTLTDLSETTYCISSTAGGRSWMQPGPAGPVVEGACS